MTDKPRKPEKIVSFDNIDDAVKQSSIYNWNLCCDDWEQYHKAVVQELEVNWCPVCHGYIPTKPLCKKFKEAKRLTEDEIKITGEEKGKE